MNCFLIESSYENIGIKIREIFVGKFEILTIRRNVGFQSRKTQTNYKNPMLNLRMTALRKGEISLACGFLHFIRNVFKKDGFRHPSLRDTESTC